MRRTETRGSRALSERTRGNAGSFARQMGVAEQTVYRWRWGVQKPQPLDRPKIRRLTGIPVEWWEEPADVGGELESA